MKCKGTKKITFKQVKIEKSFTNSRLTCYSGLTVVNDYVNHLGLFSALDEAFSTVKHNATKRFTSDALVLRLLCLRKGLDDSNIKFRLLKLGQAGSHRLLETGLRFVNNWIGKCGLSHITIDCDSSECTVFGHLSGAEKGYNPKNKGKKSYYLLFDLLENSGHEYLVKAKLTKNIKSVFEESMWRENDAKNAYLSLIIKQLAGRRQGKCTLSVC